MLSNLDHQIIGFISGPKYEIHQKASEVIFMTEVKRDSLRTSC